MNSNVNSCGQRKRKLHGKGVLQRSRIGLFQCCWCKNRFRSKIARQQHQLEKHKEGILK